MSHRTVRRIVSLVGVSSTTSVPYAAKGATWDIAIGGIPFALDPTPNKPQSRTTAKWYKNQWDISNQPGEQSLNYWWLRSQSSFHGGSGQVYLDGTDATIPASISALRYWDSIGVDVTTPGTVTLLNDTNAFPVLNVGAQMATDNDGATPVVFMSNGNVLYRITGDGTSITQVSWGGAGTILSLATDGTNYYAADATGVYRGTLAGGTGTLFYNTGNSKVAIAWIKQRLMAAIGTSIYELSGAGPGLPAAKFTHPSANWTWTDLCDSPQAIYASGYTGARSEIYKFILDSSNAVPTLTTGIVTVTMPPGELIYALANHTNTFVGVGTSRGLRVGTYSGSDIALSLSVMPLGGATCQAITIRDHFFLCSYKNSDGTAGLACVDLTNQITDGVYALSSHLRANTETTVSTVGNLLSIDDSTQASSVGTWASVANATVTRDTTFTLPGVKMVSVANGLTEMSTATGLPGYVVNGNQVYTASASWVCIGGAPFNLGLAWYDAAGNPIGVTAGVAQARTLSVVAGTISVTATAPSGAKRAAIVWMTDGTALLGDSYELQNIGLYLGTQTTFVAPTGMGPVSSTGVPTYAMGNVTGAGLLGTRLVFVVDTVGLFIENPAVKVSTGVLTTSRIRFDTSEPKMFRQVRFRGENGGAITCLVGVDESVGTTNIGSIGAGVGNDSSDIPIIEPPGDYITLTFVFATDAAGVAPVFHAYLLKALSAQARQHIIALPLVCYDRERAGKNSYGHDGFAQERLDALEALEGAGSAVLLQYLGGSTSDRRAEYVVIDSVEFAEIVPGTAKEPRGGSLNLSLRTV